MIFAKLFERDGRQIVVMKEWNDEEDMDEITLRSRTKSGHSFMLKLSFADEGPRDRAFDDMDEAKAFRIIDRTPGIDL